MATSKLIQGDTLTETSNAADGFNAANSEARCGEIS